MILSPFTLLGSMDAPRLRRIARLWSVMAGVLLALYLARQWRVGMTDGAGHPFGEDFLNFWSAARLTVTGRSDAIYDLARFHAFETALAGAPIDFYHYSYPPVMWLISAPLGLLPYGVAWLAWQVGGWCAFALALRRLAPDGWMLVAFALPAVFVNAMGGQNGCWTAAILGWGLILLRDRPVLAGMILALFVVKPQLGWLIPIVLLAGLRYRALAAFVAAALLLLLASVALFGLDPWLAYARQGALLKTVILEHGDGTWHRMLSIFILVRHLGASVAMAYGAQLAASALVATLLWRLWRAEGPSPRACAMLVMGVLTGSLYVSDYDGVMIGLAALWLWADADHAMRGRIGLAVLTPLLAAPLALASGVAVGALTLWPMLLRGCIFPPRATRGPRQA